MLEVRAKEIEKKRVLATRIEEQRLELARLPKLEHNVRTLADEVTALREQLERVKEGAVEAIMEKQALITALEEELKSKDTSQSHTAEYLELKEQFDELS